LLMNTALFACAERPIQPWLFFPTSNHSLANDVSPRLRRHPPLAAPLVCVYLSPIWHSVVVMMVLFQRCLCFCSMIGCYWALYAPSFSYSRRNTLPRTDDRTHPFFFFPPCPPGNKYPCLPPPLCLPLLFSPLHVRFCFAGCGVPPLPILLTRAFPRMRE